MAYKTKLSYEGRDNFLHLTLNQTNFINQIIDNTKGKIVVNIGSGTQRPIPNAINVDFQDDKEVDSIQSAYELSFDDESVDFVFSIGLLEHLKYPHKAISEFKRILKPNGEIYCEVPFLQPYHAAPEDYWRTTINGLETWLEDFEKIESGFSSGPSSALSWFLAEYQKYVPGTFDDSSPFAALFKGMIKYVDDYLLYDNKLDFRKAQNLACSIFFYGKKPFSLKDNSVTKKVTVLSRYQMREEKMENYLKTFSLIKQQVRDCVFSKYKEGGIAVYGTGELSELIISSLNKDNLKAVIERDNQNGNSFYYGLPVVSIENITEFGIKNIVIGSHTHKKEIHKRLLEKIDPKQVLIIEVNI